MNIVHFNVDANIKPYLKGILYSFSLSLSNLKKISNKEIIKIITIKSQSSIDKNILKFFPNLKLIVTRTVGTDHIDMEGCRDKGVEVRNILDYGSSNIAEHAVALLLAGARNIIQANNNTHKGNFNYENFIGTAIHGKTLGLIGSGRIGIDVVKIMKGFNIKIIAYDVFKNEKAAKELGFEYVSLKKLLITADFISIHVPLLPETKHMIGDKEIKQMRNGVIMVNTSRGAIIDEKALIRNIKKFKAVCLDVLEDEKSFSKTNSLLKFNNVMITPHIAFFTDDSVKRIATETEKIINNYIR